MRMSWHTIRDGEQALIFNRQGEGRLVVGPRRVSSPVRPALDGGRITSIPPVQVLLFTQQIEYLERRVASQNQYLIVQHRDGRKESVPG